MTQLALKRQFRLWARRVEKNPGWFWLYSPTRRAARIAHRARDEGIHLLSSPGRVRVLFLLLLAAGMRA